MGKRIRWEVRPFLTEDFSLFLIFFIIFCKRIRWEVRPFFFAICPKSIIFAVSYINTKVSKIFEIIQKRDSLSSDC